MLDISLDTYNIWSAANTHTHTYISKCSTSGAEEPFRIKGLKAKYITAGLLMCFSTAVHYILLKLHSRVVEMS